MDNCESVRNKGNTIVKGCNIEFVWDSVGYDTYSVKSDDWPGLKQNYVHGVSKISRKASYSIKPMSIFSVMPTKSDEFSLTNSVLYTLGSCFMLQAVRRPQCALLTGYIKTFFSFLEIWYDLKTRNATKR